LGPDPEIKQPSLVRKVQRILDEIEMNHSSCVNRKAPAVQWRKYNNILVLTLAEALGEKWAAYRPGVPAGLELEGIKR